MDPALHETLSEALQHVQGYIYPNDLSLWWSVVIVVYPYVTGLVAGAFILASLVRVFKVHALEPSYRLSLLSALAFLLVAPLPLLVHLGHPERALQVMMTPHLTSPMAVFGFVYAWYLMAVLLLELWLDYRRDFVKWSKQERGLKRLLYRALTLGVNDVSEKAIRLDDKMGRFITIIGVPSAFLLHGYVGFIFGSVKANPWWGNVLMPIIFLFSAMVSGVALMMFLYILVSRYRKVPVEMTCVDTMGKFLFSILVLDASLEALDWIHRLYEAEESIDVLVLLASGKLFISFIVIQVILGTILPLALVALTIVFRARISAPVRQGLYLFSSVLIMIGVLAMRWNVVIGGQLISKSLRGFTTYKIELIGNEGLLVSITLMLLPFLILWGLVKLFRPWEAAQAELSENPV